MSGSDMQDLATFATLMARPEMERRTVWHMLIGANHWALLLVRHKPKWARPETRRSTPRLSLKWRRKLGEDLPPENLTEEWITRDLEAEIADNQLLSIPKASSAARDAVMAALEHLGIELPASPKEAGR